MKILVADKHSTVGLAELRNLGCEVVYEPDAKDQQLVDILSSSGAEVLVVRSTKVSRAMLTGNQLALVVRAGAGYNTIDTTAASELGIFVANCPGKNAVAVAELAFGLILGLDRRIPDNVGQLREGKWNKKELSKARGLLGRTLGLVGLGNIGQAMIPRARAFGMSVVAWSRSLTPARAEELGVAYKASPADVAASCDVMSVHLPGGAGTKNMISAQVLDKLQPGAYFINTSRADVVDTEALLKVMREKQIRAGLDVYPDEPASSTAAFESSLSQSTHVYGTHHIGASTEQAEEAIASETTRIIQSFNETGQVPNVVNLASRSPARTMLVVRHRDRVGVLAHVFKILKEAGINVQEMENVVFEGAQAAIARIRLDKALEEQTLGTLQTGNADILHLKQIPLENQKGA